MKGTAMRVKKNLWHYFCVMMVLSLFGCAGKPEHTEAQPVIVQPAPAPSVEAAAGVDLDTAVKEVALQMETRLPQGTKVALVSNGKVVVVDRANLDKVCVNPGVPGTVGF